MSVKEKRGSSFWRVVILTIEYAGRSTMADPIYFEVKNGVAVVYPESRGGI